MSKTWLNADEIAELHELSQQAFGFISALQKKHPLASHLQYPKVPTELSESLVLHLLTTRSLIPELAGFTFRRRESDSDVLATRGRSVSKIEVKATTTEKGFQQVTNPLLNADYLVWLDLREDFLGATRGSVRVVVIKSPSLFIPPDKRKPEKKVDLADVVESASRRGKARSMRFLISELGRCGTGVESVPPAAARELPSSAPRGLIYVLEVLSCLRKGQGHVYAFGNTASRHHVEESTVRDKCTRLLGLTTVEFVRQAVEDTEKLAQRLSGRFPGYEDLVRRSLKRS